MDMLPTWQDALVQHEAQFGECLDVDNKANFHLLTNGLPPHGNDSFLTEFDRDGANKLFNSLQHEVIWDEEMPSDIGTRESVVLAPISTSGLSSNVSALQTKCLVIFLARLWCGMRNCFMTIHMKDYCNN